MRVFEISRMTNRNGPGIRTLVHFKGCPLRCVWCSTPESQDTAFELRRIQAQKGENIVRDRRYDQRETGDRIVGDGILLRRREDAERHPDHGRYDYAHDAELERDGEAVDDLGRYRHASYVRSPEISPGDKAPQIVPQLNEKPSAGSR